MAEVQSTAGTLNDTSKVKFKPIVVDKKERKELVTVFNAIKERDNGTKELVGRACNLKTLASQPIPDLLIGGGKKKKGKKGKTVVKKVKQFNISKFAYEQMCKQLNIPKEFIGRMSPDLMKNVFDWLLSTIEKDKKWKIKMKGKYIVGFGFDPEYKINTKDAIILVTDRITEENYILDWCIVDEEGIHVRVILPNKEIYTNQDTKDVVFAGLHINISEFQQFTPKINFIMCREKGSSAIVPIFKGRRFFKIRNVKTLELFNAELERILNPFEDRTNDIVGMCIEQIKKATSYTLDKEKLNNWLDGQRKKYKFAKSICEKTIERFEKEEQNYWGALWALAYVASKIKSPNDRLVEEYMAGLLLDSL